MMFTIGHYRASWRYWHCLSIVDADYRISLRLANSVVWVGGLIAAYHSVIRSWKDYRDGFGDPNEVKPFSLLRSRYSFLPSKLLNKGFIHHFFLALCNLRCQRLKFCCLVKNISP